MRPETRAVTRPVRAKKGVQAFAGAITLSFMHKLLGSAILLACLCLGCGDDDGNGTLIGASCDDSTECDVGGGLCVTDGEDGLCTLPCMASGRPGECPLDTYCDDQNVGIDGEAATSQTLCFPACEEDEDCREGYGCNGVSSGPGKVCHPK
jgi:hypothetical protein